MTLGESGSLDSWASSAVSAETTSNPNRSNGSRSGRRETRYCDDAVLTSGGLDRPLQHTTDVEPHFPPSSNDDEVTRACRDRLDHQIGWSSDPIVQFGSRLGRCVHERDRIAGWNLTGRAGCRKACLTHTVSGSMKVLQPLASGDWSSFTRGCPPHLPVPSSAAISIMLSIKGPKTRFCDGVSRRGFLNIGGVFVRSRRLHAGRSASRRSAEPIPSRTRR